MKNEVNMKRVFSLLFITILLLNTLLPVWSKTKSEENNYLRVERRTKHLHSRLSKKYTGYDYTIKNIYNEPVLLQGISIWDNANSKVAYLSVKRTGARAAVETLGTGVALALPTLTLSLIGSVVAVPFIIAGNQIGNVGASRESKRFDTSFTEAVTLAPQESVLVKTMALHRHHPSMRIIFKNPLTDENMFLELLK